MILSFLDSLTPVFIDSAKFFFKPFLDISFKNLLPLLEQWNESVNGEWSDRRIELILNVREEDR